MAILMGAAGFWVIDKYPPIDALYMSVITITTVGFGEIYPLSEPGRLFAVTYILVGFVVLGFVGHSIVESLLERVWSGNVREKRMKKQIERLNNHYILCGFGRVGEVAAQHLLEAGVDFVIIEPKETVADHFKDYEPLHIVGDATREQVLLKARIKQASGVLALVNSDPLNLFIVLTARELNPTLHIIARSEERDTEKKILRAGADSIISPFESAGRTIANNLLSATGRKPVDNNGSAEVQPQGPPQWMDIENSHKLIGSSVEEASRLLGSTIIGLRRGLSDYLQPENDVVVELGDKLLVSYGIIGETEWLDPQVQPEKLVIIDDNPVIVRLFTRLFQKAGFNPLSTDNGRDGFELILKEKPAVAVIDYMLPGINGLEVCRKLKRIGFGDKVKLVVFTAEDDPELRAQCLDAGADAVIVKSSDAGEIIEVVKNLVAA